MKIPKNLSLIFLIISFLFIIKNIYDLIIENYINLYEKISNISIFLLIIIVFYSIFSFSEKTINYSKVGIFIKKYFPYSHHFFVSCFRVKVINTFTRCNPLAFRGNSEILKKIIPKINSGCITNNTHYLR